MRILTLGTPIQQGQEPSPGWVRTKCQFCGVEMVCMEGHETCKAEDELVLCCMECMAKAPIPEKSMDYIFANLAESGVQQTREDEVDPWGDNYKWN